MENKNTSYANKLALVERPSKRSFTKTENRNEPRMEPCGTPGSKNMKFKRRYLFRL